MPQQPEQNTVPPPLSPSAAVAAMLLKLIIRSVRQRCVRWLTPRAGEEGLDGNAGECEFGSGLRFDFSIVAGFHFDLFVNHTQCVAPLCQLQAGGRAHQSPCCRCCCCSCCCCFLMANSVNPAGTTTMAEKCSQCDSAKVFHRAGPLPGTACALSLSHALSLSLIKFSLCKCQCAHSHTQTHTLAAESTISAWGKGEGGAEKMRQPERIYGPWRKATKISGILVHK